MSPELLAQVRALGLERQGASALRRLVREAEASAAAYEGVHDGIGPDELVESRCAHVAPGEVLPVLGQLVEVVYETEKGDDGVSHYVHPFGRPRPWLAFKGHGLVVAGGKYRVTSRGIVG